VFTQSHPLTSNLAVHVYTANYRGWGRDGQLGTGAMASEAASEPHLVPSTDELLCGVESDSIVQVQCGARYTLALSAQGQLLG
jgi:alpha-tubulin suppressor-like RCC1 family protein